MNENSNKTKNNTKSDSYLSLVYRCVVNKFSKNFIIINWFHPVTRDDISCYLTRGAIYMNK